MSPKNSYCNLGMFNFKQFVHSCPIGSHIIFKSRCFEIAAHGRARAEPDGTRAETTFRLSCKRTSPFKSAGESVQSTTGSRGARISVSNAGYTTFRGRVRVLATHSIRQFPLHFPSRASPCATTFRKQYTHFVICTPLHASPGVSSCCAGGLIFCYSTCNIIFLYLFPASSSVGCCPVQVQPESLTIGASIICSKLHPRGRWCGCLVTFRPALRKSILSTPAPCRTT
jgi:hypothetical protein